MRIIVEDEEAVERVRRAGGDKSATEAVARLIREADAGDKAPNGKRFDVITREESARARRTLRKGARS